MTSKLTREQTQQIIDAADAVITALAGTNDEVHKDDTDKMVRLWDDLNDRYAPPEVVRGLAAFRLAAMDSEPNRNPALAYADSYRDMAKQGVESVPIWSVITDLERNIAPLYRHAQLAPVVTFYRDGIEAAAKWIDQQREAYDSEHGWSDPDTGAFEFGNDAQREYSSTLEELAEGIRALHPNAGMQPALVVPDEAQSREAFEKWCQVNIERNKWHPEFYAHLPAREQWAAWEACRAAMLNGGKS